MLHYDNENLDVLNCQENNPIAMQNILMVLKIPFIVFMQNTVSHLFSFWREIWPGCFFVRFTQMEMVHESEVFGVLLNEALEQPSILMWEKEMTLLASVKFPLLQCVCVGVYVDQWSGKRAQRVGLKPGDTLKSPPLQTGRGLNPL